MYDIIGDIHGHSIPLIRLLEKLGYDNRNGYYSHPKRQVIFLGDFIDRGPDIQGVLEIVRPMIDNDAALAVMGNHEYNAICYHYRKPGQESEFFRAHTDLHVAQHLETILQFRKQPNLLYDYVDWFARLPVFLELEHLRVVHACWDEELIRYIRQQTGGRNSFPVSEDLVPFLAKATQRGVRDPMLKIALGVTLKGKEVHLPDGVHFFDKDGARRTQLRVTWWKSGEGQTFRSMAIPTDEAIPDEPLPEEEYRWLKGYAPTEKPVFIGHYWLRGSRPILQASNICCVDFSVAKGGFLCAYRFQPGESLHERNFVWVPCH